MENELNENWNKLYQCISKPVTEFAELNAEMLSNLSKHTIHVEELSKSNQTDDLLLSQMKLLNLGQYEFINYAKKAGDIWISTLEQLNEFYDTAHDSMEKSTKPVKAKSKASV